MRLSLKQVLITGIIGLQLITVSAILFSSYVTTQDVLLRHARLIISNVAGDAIHRSATFLMPAEKVATLTQRLARSGVISTSVPDAMERYFYEQLRQYEQFEGIYFGAVNGDFYYVKRQPKNRGGYLTKIISAGIDRKVTLIERQDDFSKTAQRFNPQDKYDPRKRPWFRKAVKQKSTIWTDPYIFFTSRRPGITAASPVYDGEGRLKGVVGVDISIEDISGFLSGLKIGKNGSAFIMNRNGDVIAFPNSEKIKRNNDNGTLRFTKIGEIDDPVSRAAFASLNRPADAFDLPEPVFTSFSVNGARYHAVFTPFSNHNWPWVAGIYVPESDFLGEIRDNQIFNIYLAIAIGLLACMIGYAFANSIGRPMARLGTNATIIKDGRKTGLLPIESRYAEIADTVDAFSQMVESLREEESKNQELTKGLRLAHAELEARVDARTRELTEEIIERRKAEEAAENASRVKSNFLANMSHEFRTPLNAIIGFSDTILKQMFGPLGHPKYIEYANDIHESGVHLLQLINDVLDLSTIEAGKLELRFERVSIPAVIDMCLRIIRPRAEQGMIALITDIAPDTPDIEADELRLRQILINLLTNAVKFTPEGGSVTISTRRLPNGGAAISIKDTGVGMDQAGIEHALTLFGHANSSLARKHEGTGLGLPLTKELVEAHGGILILDSAVGVGTTATVQFPPERSIG